MKKEKYFLGIFGGILGGLIASIPWILMYVYADLIYSLLALIIAFGVLKGYQIFEGKIDHKLPWIIGLISFICVSISTLIIIPNLLLLKEYGTLSWSNFKLLYTTKEFIFSLCGDYILAFLFTMVGVAGVIQILKYKDKNLVNISAKQREKIKSFFKKYDALTKEKAISKEELINGLNLEKNELKTLIQVGVIKKYRKNYYFNNQSLKNKRNFIIIVIGVLLLGVVINIFTSDKNRRSVKPITYEIASTYKEYKYNENNDIGWSYMPKQDTTGESGIIYVFYYQNDTLTSDNKAAIMEDVFKSENGYIDSEIFTNNYGHEVLYVEFALDDYYAYYYYIFNDKEYAFVEGSISQNVNNIELKKDTRKVAETLTWN